MGRPAKMCVHGVLGVRTCIQCRRASNAKWAAENSEKVISRTTNWRRQWRENNPEAAKHLDRRHNLKRKGWTVESYERCLREQAGVCLICRKPPLLNKPLHIDHDHETGEFRGLLHALCNRALGFLGDDPQVLESAAQYLRKCRLRKVA